MKFEDQLFTNKKHHFHPKIAAEIGIVPAILFSNVFWMIAINKQQGINAAEGTTWARISIKNLCEFYPYLGYDKIFRTLKSLTDQKILIRKKLKSNFGDQTYSYCLAMRGFDMLKATGEIAEVNGSFFDRKGKKI